MNSRFERRELCRGRQLLRAFLLQLFGPQLQCAFFQARLERFIDPDADAGQNGDESSDLEAAPKLRPVRRARHQPQPNQDQTRDQAAYNGVAENRPDTERPSNPRFELLHRPPQPRDGGEAESAYAVRINQRETESD